jgi:hypothetical protein
MSLYSNKNSNKPVWLAYRTHEISFSTLITERISTTDDPPSPQPAMTPSILWLFHQTAFSPFDKALCELFIGAFFFAMRSCEYVHVTGTWKTKVLKIKNINFYRGTH